MLPTTSNVATSPDLTRLRLGLGLGLRVIGVCSYCTRARLLRDNMFSSGRRYILVIHDFVSYHI